MPDSAPNILNNTFTQSAISRLMSEVTSFLNNHWIEVLVVSVVIALFSMLFAYLKKRKAASKLEKERKEIREDLKAWKDLAKEKEAQEEAEQERSEKLKQIENIYKHGLDIIKQAGKDNDDVNWLMILGEPQSGKSQLLKSSSIEFLETGSTNDKDEDEDSANVADNLPLRCWLSGNAYVLDVGGKEFFEKDNPGQMNEWKKVIELVNKTKKKKPLGGIIVVIPADALITDNEEISIKKSSLIAKKIYSMVNDLGVILPCHVVVTKLDMVLGCVEYFGNLKGEAVEQVFGWRNTKLQGAYDKKEFSTYWKELINKLRAGSMSNMLNEKIHDINFSKGQNRLSITSNAYLFADEFDKIKKNLFIYLEHLFGTDTWFSSDNFMLSGVYFTLAQDGRVRLSSTVSEITNKPVEASALISKAKIVEHSYFVKKLLSDLIFTDKKNSSYTVLKTIKKNIVYYVCSAVALILALVWITSIYFNTELLDHAIQSRTRQFDSIIRLANENAILNSPLVAEDKDGKFVFCDSEPMSSKSIDESRLSFFNTYMMDSKESYVLPGYWLASLYTFWDVHMSHYGIEACKHVLFEDMVFTPTIELFCKRLNSDNVIDEKFNATKRQAILDLIEISTTNKKVGFGDLFVEVPFASILTYLKPDITKRQLSIFGVGEDGKVQVSKRELSSLLVRPEFERAIGSAVMEMMSRWERLDIYPDSGFSEMCACIEGSAKYKDLEEKIRSLVKRLGNNYSDDYVCLAEIDNCISKQRELLPPMEKYFSSDWMTSHLIPLSGEIVLNKLYAEYEKLLDDDYAFLRKVSEGTSARNYSFNRSAESIGKTVYSKNSYMDLETSYSTAKNLLAEKKKKILARRTDVAKDGYFFSDSALKSIPLFKIIDNLQKHSEVNHVINGKLIEEVALPDLLLELEKYADQKMNDLNDYAATLPKTEETGKCILTYKSILETRINEIKYRLFEEYFYLSPKSAEGLANYIREQSDGYSDGILGMNLYLVEECFGPIQALDEYDYNIEDHKNKRIEKYFEYLLKANNSIKPTEEVKQSETTVGSATKDVTSKNLNYIVPKELMPEYELFRDAIRNYYRNYIDYWGHFVENNITHNDRSWKEFKDTIVNLNANQINTLLNVGYSNSIHLIKDVDDIFLDGEGIALKQKLLGMLGAKQQTLSPVFLEICNRNLNNWAALSNDAKNAYIYLQNLPLNQKKADFMAVANKESAGSIGWWRQFVNNGMDILKHEAISGFKEDIDEVMNQRPIITYNPDGTKNTIQPKSNLKLGFPVCRDTKVEMSVADMRKLSGYLSSLGFDKSDNTDLIDATEQGEEVEILYVDEDLGSESLGVDAFGMEKGYGRISSWAPKALNIIEALTSGQPATFSLILPPASVQAALSKDFGEGKLPLAVYKYPYISVTSGLDMQRTDVLTSAASRDMELTKGLLCDNCLAIKMFTYADSVRPDAFIDVVGSWAPLRLYLLHKSKMDVAKNIVYVSVVFEDPNKERYILWLGYRFGTALPLPNEWPMLKDDSITTNAIKSVSNPAEFSKLKNGQIAMPQEFKPENMVNIDVGDDKNTVTILEDEGSLIKSNKKESEAIGNEQLPKVPSLFKARVDQKTIDRRLSIKEKIDFLRERMNEE